MITESKVRDFEKSQPLPSFRLNAPNTNPFVPSLPTSVTGDAPALEFTWKTDSTGEIAASYPNQAQQLLAMVERLRRETVRFPSSASAHINLAAALLNQGSIDDAEDELRLALSLEKTSYVARLKLANILARREKFEEAVELYSTLLSENSHDNTVLVSLAVLSLRKKYYEEAKRYLQQACANKTGDATVHFLLGMAHLCTQDLRGAIAELRAACRIEVRNPAIHQALGVVFALRSEFDRAEQEFRAALMFVPQDKSSLRALYQVLLNQKKSAEAVEVLTPFVDRYPTDGAAREALALGLLDLKRYPGARFHLTRLLAEAKDATPAPVDQIARIQANIGLTWLLEGRIESARRAFVDAIDTYPNVSPIAYENLARLLLNAENYDAAVDVLKRSRNLFPDRADTVVLLSHTHSLVGEEHTGIRELEAFRSRYPATEQIYVHLAFLYSQVDDMARSMGVSREGADRFPHSVMILNNLAYVCAMMDRLEEARVAMRMAPKGLVPHAEWIATKGLLRLREGDERAGVALYEEAESVASEMGNKDLARRVRQKKHLELARFWLKKKDIQRGRIEIKRGLDIKVKFFSYEWDLKRLDADLSRQSIQLT